MFGPASVRWSLVISLGLPAVLSALGCDSGGGPEGAQSWFDGGIDPAADGGTTKVALTCKPAQASEDLGPRVAVLNAIGMGGPSAGGPRIIQVTELFDRFNTLCGQCHVATANGNRQTSAKSFTTTVDATWLAPIKSDDPTKSMPPDGKAYSARPDTDPVRQLVIFLEAWLTQNRPSDMFTVDSSASAMLGGTDPLTAAQGSYAYPAMTNLGDCIPPAVQYAQSPSDEMKSKDDLFAKATELPANLSDTDLTTFDADTLAANGVVAFVPTYPLWSDGSGKLRHIRVPKGTSVKFDKATQTFTIPPNTRFYKTFFRKVTDAAGRSSNRKIETRLIVARPDTLEADGKTPHQNALFGTYLWTDDELTATLLTTPYRDGTAWADRTMPYVVDEIAYRDVVMSLGTGSAASLPVRLADALRSRPDVLQHYAVPGRIRCVQCHQGSLTQNFVLGFLPQQIGRRAAGTGGTYEPTGADELSQLKRLIDYGVVTGMTSPADVVPLEQAQLPRKPRTDEELNAQAYMIGNCMHCHNPRGFPSLAKPELAGMLNFAPGPGPAGGGIFEFPLDRMSPVRSRGASQDIPIPYITPSLYDYPVATVDGMKRIDDGNFIAEASTGGPSNVEQTWTPKYLPQAVEKTTKPGVGADSKSKWEAFLCGGKGDGDLKSFCGKRTSGSAFVYAPWRSLIYRNVDTPFPYFDDYVPFPHMPMNTAGFDCRAPRIMGDWMVSLPALRKMPWIPEEAVPFDGHEVPDSSSYWAYDTSPQPYYEVHPGEPDYEMARQDARDRLEQYRADIRYNYCQDELSPDILDPLLTPYDKLSPDFKALASPTYHPDPERYILGGLPPADPSDVTRQAQPTIGVPYHAHWFDYDPTDAPPPWKPRRGDAWQAVLLDHVPDEAVPAGQTSLSKPSPDSPSVENDLDKRRRVTEALGRATLTDELRTYATTPVPFGLWEDKPECAAKLAAHPKVSDVAADAAARGVPPPAWMTLPGAAPAPGAPVFQMSPGAALYRHICFNCHGPRADGKGLQGDALAASSEGQARPANFREGLFGPRADPGANLRAVFGGKDQDLVTARNVGSRYMAWMALGGTLQLIPQDIIHQVEATKVLGHPRPNVARTLSGSAKGSANMLELAKGLCGLILPDPSGNSGVPHFRQGTSEEGQYPFITSDKAPFVRETGDWEMWMNLCSRFSPPVVRVFKFIEPDAMKFETRLEGLYYADADGEHPGYPKSAPVLDHNRQIQLGVDARNNYFPACLAPQEPGDPEVPQFILDAFARDTSPPGQAGGGMPVCPREFLNGGGRPLYRLADSLVPDDPIAAQQRDNIAEWTVNGAINAGMSVFSYLSDPQAFDPDHPAPYYNECQLLP